MIKVCLSLIEQDVTKKSPKMRLHWDMRRTVIRQYFCPGSGGQDLSYSTKRKMSQRQKRTRVHRGTQTEEIYFMDPLPRELTEDSEYYGGRELHERLLKAEEVRVTSLDCKRAQELHPLAEYKSRTTLGINPFNPIAFY